MRRALKGSSWLCLLGLVGCADELRVAGPGEWDGGQVKTDVDPSEDDEDDPYEDEHMERDASLVPPDAGTRRSPTFRNVYALLVSHCLACHGEEGSEIFGELSFKTRSLAHRQLVGSLALGNLCFDGKRQRVVAGDPEASLLVQKLEKNQDCGMPMPTHGDPLAQEEVALVREWISLGAMRD